MPVFEPPPTYANPVLIDEKTKTATFNPIWLKWFLDLTQALNSGGGTSLGTVSSVQLSGGSTGLTSSGGPVTTAGTLTLGGALVVGAGGTGITSYTVGDITYADTTHTLAKLADAAVGNVLLAGGVGVAPGYGQVNLSSMVTGILPISEVAVGTFVAGVLAPTGSITINDTGGTPRRFLIG